MVNQRDPIYTAFTILNIAPVLRENYGLTITKSIAIYNLAMVISYIAVFPLLIAGVVSFVCFRIASLDEAVELLLSYYSLVVGYIAAYICGRYYADVGTRSTHSFAFAMITVLFISEMLLLNILSRLLPDWEIHAKEKSPILTNDLFVAISWFITGVALVQGRNMGIRQRAVRLRQEKGGKAQWFAAFIIVLYACFLPFFFILGILLQIFLAKSFAKAITWGVFAVSFSYILGLVRSLSMSNWEFEQDEDERKPVLFLRSFREDRNRQTINLFVVFLIPYLAFLRRNEEELLAKVFRKYGPFLAIGCPGERLAPSGASRKYLRQDLDWHDVVETAIQDSQLIVLQVPNEPSEKWGEGLRWEISQILEESRLRQKSIFFYLGIDRRSSERLQELIDSLQNYNHIPNIQALKNCEGVFLGFHGGQPEVICRLGAIANFLSPFGSAFFIRRSLSKYFSGRVQRQDDRFSISSRSEGKV